MSEPTAFQWWAEIIVPSLVGLATVAVAVAAIVASRRATKIAHEVEQYRIDEGKRREAEENRRSLLATAQSEAREVRRWIQFVVDHRYNVTTPTNRDPKEAEVAATVALEQSFVPGASELLAITRQDLARRYYFMPPVMEFPDGFADSYGGEFSQLQVDVVAWRVSRTIERVRVWSLDPEAAAPAIRHELSQALGESESYWDYRQGVPGLERMPVYKPDDQAVEGAH